MIEIQDLTNPAQLFEIGFLQVALDFGVVRLVHRDQFGHFALRDIQIFPSVFDLCSKIHNHPSSQNTL